MRRIFGEIFRRFSSFNFQGKWPQKKFTKNPRHFPRCTKLSFFHCCNSGGLGAQEIGLKTKMDPENLEQKGRVSRSRSTSAENLWSLRCQLGLLNIVPSRPKLLQKLPLRMTRMTCFGAKRSKSHDLIAIATCDSNRESQITSDLRQCQPP